MRNTPELFDHALKALRANRVKEAALFLHDIAIAECKERIKQVNKTFNAALIVGWQTPYWQAHLGLQDVACCDYRENLALDGQGPFDLIIHAMALHWANDPVGQLIQMRRALRPDGMVLLACLGAGSLTQLRAVLMQVEIDVLGGVSPRLAPMGDVRDLGGLLQRAGFALSVADRIGQDVRYQSAYALLRDLRAMGESNVMHSRQKACLPRRFWAQLDAAYPRGKDNKITAHFEMIMLTGFAPSPEQPKPLRPGSAKMRLADALGTHEKKV